MDLTTHTTQKCSDQTHMCSCMNDAISIVPFFKSSTRSEGMTSSLSVNFLPGTVEPLCRMYFGVSFLMVHSSTLLMSR